MRRLLADSQGNVFILTALGILLLVAVSGVAIDLGRQQLIHARMEQSSDAAALAAAAITIPMGSDPTQVRHDTAQRYFSLNFTPNYLGVAQPPANIDVGNTITVSTNGTMKTMLVSVQGINSMKAGGSSTVQIGDNELTQRDLILVMDNSDSMKTTDAGNGETRMQALKDAAGIINTALLNPNTSNSHIAAITWSDTIDASQAFSDSYNTIQDFINNMVPQGGTNSTSGLDLAKVYLAQARSNTVHAIVYITDGFNGSYVAAPWETRGVNPPTLQDCASLKASGAIVYTIAFGQEVQWPCRTFACTTMPQNQQQANQFCHVYCSNSVSPSYYNNDFSHCTDINNQTWMMGFDVNSSTYCPKPMLQACASAPDDYFEAPDAATLNAAFNTIVNQVKNIRIVQ